MPVRLLKAKASLPYALEHRLVTHWGYAVEKRSYLNGAEGPYILFKKPYISDNLGVNDAGVKRTIRASIKDNVTSLAAVKAFDSLTKFERTQLEKRCDNIVAFFPDPYAAPSAVRTRLVILQQKLAPAEAAFVQYYTDENFPE